eukprot:3418065-Amphidinium_carterae.1
MSLASLVLWRSPTDTCSHCLKLISEEQKRESGATAIHTHTRCSANALTRGQLPALFSLSLSLSPFAQTVLPKTYDGYSHHRT